MAAAAANDKPKLKKVALVAPWLHTPEMATAIYGGPETASKLLAASDEAATKADHEDPPLLVCGSTTDDKAIMFQAPYYSENNRGLIQAYDNKFNILSWKPWLTYNALESADRLDKPMLLVGSDGIALPDGVKAYEQRLAQKNKSAILEKVWLDKSITQFDFCDNVAAVKASADAVAAFFQKE